MNEIQPAENESNFDLFDRLKRFLDELFYQIKLFPRLSNEDRSRLFSRYRAADLIGIVAYLRKQEKSDDALVRRMAARLCERTLLILRKVESEREEQMRLMIHRDLPPVSVQVQEVQEKVLRELDTMELDPQIREKIQLRIKGVPGPEPLSQEAVELEQIQLPVPDDSRLESLFESIFSGSRLDRNALFEFLSLDSGEIVKFLEVKSIDGTEIEKSRALELTRLVPRKDTINLLGRILKQSHGEIRKKTDRILDWYRSQQKFSRYHQLIDSIRDQMRRKSQLYSRKEKQVREDEERKELYLEYFEMISDPHEEARVALLKGLGSEGYGKNRRFVENVFEREPSVSIRSLILKDVARYRVEDLYGLFEKAFLSEAENLIYHAVLYVKEYSLCPVLMPLQRHKAKFKKFNEQFATQVISLLA